MNITDPNLRSIRRKALSDYIRSSNIAIISKLLTTDLDINEYINGKTPIMELGESSMSESTKIEILILFLKSGADPNLCDIDGYPAFYYFNTLNLVTVLIDYPLNLNLQNQNGETVLMSLINKRYNPEILKLYLELGKYDLNIVNKLGQNFLDVVEFSPQDYIYIVESFFGQKIYELRHPHINTDTPLLENIVLEILQNIDRMKLFEISQKYKMPVKVPLTQEELYSIFIDKILYS